MFTEQPSARASLKFSSVSFLFVSCKAFRYKFSLEYTFKLKFIFLTRKADVLLTRKADVELAKKKT